MSWRRTGIQSIAASPGGGAPGPSAGVQPPLRAELFSADQMEQHGVRLASADRLAPGRVPEQLLSRLAENQRVLV